MNFNSFFGLLILCLSLMACQEQDLTQDKINLNVIPKPVKWQQKTDGFAIDPLTTIVINSSTKGLDEKAKYLADLLKPSIGTIEIVDENEPLPNSIFLSIDSSLNGKNGYHLSVTSKYLSLKAGSLTGIFSGIQTIRQLLPESVESPNSKSNQSLFIPGLEIEDYPRFDWRGMHLDVSRHFFSIEYLKKFIDRLALYKFNKLHLHLTDDQGWRIEIKKYPKLTKEGAWRTLNGQDSTCYELAENNPDFLLPEEHFKTINGKRVYGGFYTQEEMKQLIAYADQRHITIVPEIDMPGHMNAAISSYPFLTCQEEKGWGDTFSIPICPCEARTYEFAEGVLSEIASLFPGKYIHIGGDEVEKTTWSNSTTCKELMKKEGIENVEELQSYFIKRMEQFLLSKGKQMIGWDEVLEGGVDSTTTIMYWRGWVPEAPEKASLAGNEVIMSPTSHCYFDYAQDESSLAKVYGFEPIPTTLNDQQQQKIIGLQANLWSEYIPSPARCDYMAMPRMIALSEVAWSTGEKDWDDFAERMKSHYQRMDQMGINYRLPGVVNATSYSVFQDSLEISLRANSEDFTIRYTTDGSSPNDTSKIYDAPFYIDKSTKILAATFKNGRKSEAGSFEFKKQDFLKPVDMSDSLQNGLQYTYYERGYRSVLEIKEEDFVSKGVVDSFQLLTTGQEDNFAIKYNGFIEVPETGIYTFYTISDDGSTLSIGNRSVVENDFPHGAKEAKGQVALEKGLHPIEVRFFELGGSQSLEVSYEGDRMTKQPIPTSALYIKVE